MTPADALVSGLEQLKIPNQIVGSIYTQCFPRQLAYVTDASRLVAALCSRKAGKTGGNVRRLVATAMRAGESMAVYACQSIEAAYKAIWDNPDGLPVWLRKNQVDCKISEQGLVEFPNGSLIRVTGINSRKTADDWRAIRSDCFILDEAQAWDDKLLAYVLEEVAPATQIVRGGQLVISGTPDRKCRGYFHDATVGKRQGWNVHRWTWRDNPHLREAKAWVAEEMQTRGINESTPAFRREFNGEWVGEEGSLCYRFDHERNTFTELPFAADWQMILGVDQGYEDMATFALGAWHSHSPVLYFREVYGERHCLPTRYAEVIKSYQATHEEIGRVVMDCGALGKPVAEMLRREPYNLNITPAQKTEKRAAQQLFNDALRTGRIKVDPKRCAPLIEEWSNLQVDEEGNEDQSSPNDYCDAALYAFRHASPHLATEPLADRVHPGRRPPPDPRLEEQRMLERAEARMVRDDDGMGELLGDYGNVTDGLFE